MIKYYCSTLNETAIIDEDNYLTLILTPDVSPKAHQLVKRLIDYYNANEELKSRG